MARRITPDEWDGLIARIEHGLDPAFVQRVRTLVREADDFVRGVSQNHRGAGVVARHSRRCVGQFCCCHPSYEGWVYDAAAGRKIRRTFRTHEAAVVWRNEMLRPHVKERVEIVLTEYTNRRPTVEVTRTVGLAH